MSTAPVIAVVSPKGGNGKTTIASNLAVSLARRTPTLIVDLDVHFGDVEYALRMRPVHRLDDVVAAVGEGRTDLQGLLASHPSGLEVLCAPHDPVAADRLDPGEVLAAVDVLFGMEQPVVLDTAGGISEFTLGAIDRATHVLLVSGTDVPSIQSGRKLLDSLRALDMPLDAIRLVINRSTTQVGLSAADVEEVLGVRAALLVPERASLAAAMNAGSPITESSPRSALAAAFHEFADELLGHGQDHGRGAEPRRRFRLLRSGAQR